MDGERFSAPDALDPPAPGATCRSAINSSERGYDNGLSSTLLRTLKTAVFAPMPTASVNTTTTVNVRLWRMAAKRVPNVLPKRVDDRNGELIAIRVAGLRQSTHRAASRGTGLVRG